MERRLATVVVVLVVVLAGCSGGTLPEASPDDATATGGDGDAGDRAAGSTSNPGATANGTLEVHFVNVGQSVSTLVVGPTGETMLVDSGDWRDDGRYVLAYLKRHGIERIDYLVTSHADADHIGGHAAVVDYYETEADGVGAIYDPGIASSTKTYESYLDAVEEHGVTLYRTQAGDAIPMAGVEVAVLGPPSPPIDDEDRNENSVVLRLDHGDASFLLTGDAEADGERWLVDRYRDRLNVTVLKAGHHGSGSSTGATLLDATRPKAVVISSAYDSPYGHPHESVLRRLAVRSIPTYWTAVHGTVVFVSDGRNVTVGTQASATTDPLELRSARAVEPGSETSVRARAVVPAGGAGTSGGGTAGDGGGRLKFVTVHADAAGPDGDNLNDEYIVLENTGDQALDIGGWTVTDEANHVYTVPAGVTLEPGDRITLHTGSGTDTATDRYWGASSPVWNNDGDTVTVRASDGDTVLREGYP